MAKRFTDTGKWDKAWFRKLDPVDKCIWMFLCDRCDHAGVWEIDVDAFDYFVGSDAPTLDTIFKVFGEKLVRLSDDKLLVKDFIDFQYGTLNPDNRVHKSVLNRLEKLAPKKGLISPLQGAKDKEKDKDKDKDKVLRGGAGEILEALYQRYPRKLGKADGLKRLKSDLKAGATIEQLDIAMDNTLAHHKTIGTAAEFVPYFSTWTSSWRDWLDPNTGQAEDFSNKPDTLANLDLEAV